MLKTYYLRDKKNNPVVTVALLKHGHETTRGIAICSVKDQFDYEKGRAYAIDRATMAMLAKCDVYHTMISKPIIQALSSVFYKNSNGMFEFAARYMMGNGRKGFHMGLYNPMLSTREAKMLDLMGSLQRSLRQ